MRKRKVLIALAAMFLILLAVAGVYAATSGNGESETARVTFTNTSDDQPDLFVKKTVTTVLAGYTVPDVSFTFVLKWDLDKDGELETASKRPYTLYDVDGTVIAPSTGTYWYTGSDGSFELKDGQTARFTYVGKGITYEVTETNLEELNASGKFTGTFSQTTPSAGGAASGTVAADGTIVYFENSYIPENDDGEEGDLVIRKDIRWSSSYDIPADFDMGEFTFTIKIGSAAYANQVYTLYDTESGNQITAKAGDTNAVKALDDSGNEILDGDGNATYIYRTDADGQFTIAAGQYAVFEDVEVPIDYHVSEADTDGWYAIGEVNDEGATESPIVYLTFTNAPTLLIVEKDMEDVNLETDTGFRFLLTDGNGDPVDGQEYYLYDSDGNLVTKDANGDAVTQPLATDANGNFTLDAGQRALFYNLKLGEDYTVKEIVPDGAGYFLASASSSSGGALANVTDSNGGAQTVTVSKDTETLSYVNGRYGSLKITKKDQFDKLLEGVEFTLYDLTDYRANGENATAIGTQTTDSKGEAAFNHLKAGTYALVETKVPVGYVGMSGYVEVTIPYETSKAIVDANKIDTSGNVVYDEKNQIYYFYDVEYTVTNSALIDLPSAGTMNWPIVAVCIGGCILTVAAAVLLFAARRRKERAI
ncbi:MAG: DUF5979 domain-containing protein [Lachnospiraceae bacterium]|nr:DUF5979 domain-containing protein [Lachnospiraceae bacterium]